MMNTRRSLLLVVPLLIVAFIYKDTLISLADHSVQIWSASGRISRDLKGARSVAFVEFDGKTDTAVSMW